MKNLIFTLIALSSFSSLIAQVNEVELSGEGIIVPRLDHTTIISPEKGQLVYDVNSESYWFHNGTEWVALPSMSNIDELSDSDGDTKIQVEESTDEDAIRFDIGGSQFVQLNGKTLEIDDGNEGVYVGSESGKHVNGTYSRNTAVGYEAMQGDPIFATNSGCVAIGFRSMMDVTSGSNNIAIGMESMRDATTALGNVCIGTFSSQNNSEGARNSALGGGSLFNLESGYDNVVIGNSAGFSDTEGSSNVYIGSKSGGNGMLSTVRDSSIFIGYRSGYDEQGSNKLYIENSGSSTPLIWGDFLNDSIKIHGTLGIKDEYSFPNSDGSFAQVMHSDGSGDLFWDDLHSIEDDEGDSKVSFISPSNEIRFTSNSNIIAKMIPDSIYLAGNLKVGTGVLSRIYIGNTMMQSGGPTILRMDTNIRPFEDDMYDLGSSGKRWKEVFSVNSTINTSDRRLKTNIATLKYGLKEVLLLDAVDFNWLNETNGDKKHLGLIAQDLEKIIPEAVVVPKNDEEYYGVRYTELIPVLIKSIQELSFENTALKESNILQAKAIEKLNSEVSLILKKLTN